MITLVTRLTLVIMVTMTRPANHKIDHGFLRCGDNSENILSMLINILGHLWPDRFRSPRCLTPDNVTGVQWFVACANGSTYGRDNRKNFSMAVGVILILCVSGMMAICVAVHENVKTRQAMRRRRQIDGGEYGGSDARAGGGVGGNEYYDEFAAAAESLRKLSQLPSYDEAIMLPKPSEPSARLYKRHSCTQTEQANETDEADEVDTNGHRDGRLLTTQEAVDSTNEGAGIDRLLSPPGFRSTQL